MSPQRWRGFSEDAFDNGSAKVARLLREKSIHLDSTYPSAAYSAASLPSKARRRSADSENCFARS